MDIEKIKLTIKKIVYDRDNLTGDEFFLLKTFIEFKAKKRFLKLYGFDIDYEDESQSILTKMMDENGFFTNFKNDYPNSDEIDNNRLFRKFQDKVEKMFEKKFKYLIEKYKTLCDAEGLPENFDINILKDLNELDTLVKTDLEKVSKKCSLPSPPSPLKQIRSKVRFCC